MINIDSSNTREAIIALANYIQEFQEQVEYKLSVLDSSNIVEIDLSKTKITDTDGNQASHLIRIKGNNGEVFTVGNNKGKFEFTLKGKNGKLLMHIDDSGKLVINE